MTPAGMKQSCRKTIKVLDVAMVGYGEHLDEERIC